MQMHKVRHVARTHRKKLLWAGAGLVGLLLFVQLFYPGDRLPLNARIDGVNVSGWKKQDATWQLDRQVAEQKIDVRLGQSDDVYATAKPSDIGLTITNEVRIDEATYPWWARLIPTSLFWYGLGMKDDLPTYTSDKTKARAYLNTALGNSCNIPPKNASLTHKDGRLELVEAKAGGACKEEQAITALANVRPVPGEKAVVEIPVEVRKPAVTDDDAGKLAQTLQQRTAEGVRLAVGDTSQVIPQQEVLSWLSFSSDKKTLTFLVDADKANGYFAKNVTPAVAKPAGISRITTRDFTVVSQSIGATGRTLALSATLNEVAGVLSGTRQAAQAITTSVAPKVVYSRSYTKTSTGIAAMLLHYDQDHDGTFGVAFREVSGRGLSAEHNASQSFTTASTYKLYVAYGTLRKVDAGKWKWSDADIAGGRSLSVCFDDMIVKSDNACAEALLKKLGYGELTKDIHTLGLKNSSFTRGDTPSSTAGDLALFLQKLQSGSLPVKAESRARLLDAMKRNVYRQGIPAGASGQTANKVGFLWGLLHDASIVYSPKGTYVLVILSDGSSWANLAELTRKIEALR